VVEAAADALRAARVALAADAVGAVVLVARARHVRCAHARRAVLRHEAAAARADARAGLQVVLGVGALGARGRARARRALGRARRAQDAGLVVAGRARRHARAVLEELARARRAVGRARPAALA